MNWGIVREPTILVTAAAYGLLELIAIQAGLFGIWLGVLLFFSLWRYSYAVLRAVAQGRVRIPAPDADSFNIVGEWGVFWHLMLFPGLLVAGLLYPPGGWAVSVAVAVMFPASAAVMGLRSDIVEAVSPATLKDVMRTLGADYAWLVIVCLGLLAGAFTLIRLLAGSGSLVLLLVSLIVEVWALLASFALVGAALRAHRLEFEIPGELRPREEEMLEQRHVDWRRDLDIAYTSFRSGLDAAGYRTLRALVDANGDSIEANHWLVENMLDWEDRKYACDVAARLIPRLVTGGDEAAALDLYQRCRRRRAEFRLPRSDADRLADYARSVGHTGLADELSYNR